jgi:hypothetical protein
MATNNARKSAAKRYYMKHRIEIIRKTVNRSHITGKHMPMEEKTDCALYLGIVIAEQALLKFFDNITQMPNGNKGFDFICGRGLKIDVKSACMTNNDKYNKRWVLRINKNIIADYFLVLLFDNRRNLAPMHVILIPGNVINMKTTISISNSPKTFEKWKRYEQPLDKVVECCNKMRRCN